MRTLFLALFITLAIRPPAVHAAELDIFIRGKRVENYDDVLRSVRENDLLRFDKKTSFEILRIHPPGGNTRVFRVRKAGVPLNYPPAILRVPKNTFWFRFLEETSSGHAPLRRAGIRVPDLLESRAGMFNLMEETPFDFYLSDLLSDSSKFSNELKEKALSALEQFARSSAPFEWIGDFRPDQLVYSASDNEWVLLDWNRWSRYVPPGPGRGQIFTPTSPYSLKHHRIYKRMSEIIEHERLKPDFSQFVDLLASGLGCVAARMKTEHLKASPQ
jgi:hypothetical protein